MTLEELEKQIVVQQCVPGEGLSAGYSVNIPSTGRVLRYVTKDRMVTIPDKINESLAHLLNKKGREATEE